ncbi:interferon alpha-inducible protein 27-like protein 1 isoform X2 [Numida meleagris]|uniref:interferon alpha-inducible protein 27-like protein 1 isoform X2 n=1 Tax=Numida meleagris TaxID=8996 RepID=UPI000B3D94D6|nr:interferon alpha-inducible protein 27-like protein 1 isoform X2 [Numida meleagris]
MLQAAAMGPFTKAAIGGSVAAGAFLVGFPLVVSSLGFTAAGIAAGSVAAKMMSVAAIANGGGVAAGSTVAVLQSIGAAGLSLGAKVGLTSAFASLGALIGSKIPSGEDDEAEEPAAA